MGVRLQELESLLKIGSDDQVRMVGIWGLGGSGKTTLATSLYRKMFHCFPDHCLLGNVRVRSSGDGLRELQSKILSKVCQLEVEVQSVEDGRYKIKDMLCRRKVLIILDDVDTLNQLEALAGDCNWFGNGSRILITTRDEHLLAAHGVDFVLPSILLSKEHSFKLFNRHAFRKNTIKDYGTLSLDAVSYADGLPLALKLLGSFLNGKTKDEWNSALEKLKVSPHPPIISILITSYEGLEAYQKELFLNIACFLISRKVDDVKNVFEACNYYPDIGLRVLREKALITFDKDGRFKMHDLVRDMGHDIVRNLTPNDSVKPAKEIYKEIKEMWLHDAKEDN